MRRTDTILHVLALLLSSTPSAVWAADDGSTPCTVSDAGKYYDLSPLSRKHDYIFQAYGRNYTLNVCQSVRSELWNLDAESVGGFYRGDHGDLSIGKFNSTPVTYNGDPYIFMSDGSQCTPGVDRYASTAVHFVCDLAVASEGNPQLLAQLPPDSAEPCAFFVEWRTKFACPSTKQAGTGGFIAAFSAILFIAFLAYIFGGLLYNRYVLGLRGRDQIPAYSLFSLASCQTVLYSIMDKWDDWRSRRGNGGGGGQQWGSWRAGGSREGFSRLPREEEEAILEGRLSFDDEEEGPILYNDIHRQQNMAQQPNGTGANGTPGVAGGAAGKV